MCGIAGQFLVGHEVDPRHIRAMCDEIRHRGPDEDGYHVEGACGIGMRRLSIIDLETGQQPIANEDKTVWSVLNGEIYNYRELRTELVRRGHSFRTRSDTETLVHLYEEEGTVGVLRLRGMFAYAIFDSRDQSLLLVRDRFGKKPLYFAALPEGLFFASELKSLRAAGVPLDLDYEALRLYCFLNYIPDPWSPYLAIRKLPAGGWMRYHANGRIETGQYWRMPVPAEEPLPGVTETSARDHLRRLFDDSVKSRLVADVPLGAFLSGGIDSSSVVASMAVHSGARVKTFSIGFEEPEFNELPLARATAKKYDTEHHELIVHPDSVEPVEKLVHHFDEPFGDSSAIPTYLVSRFAAQHVKVVLTGDGGDELFAGYDSFATVQQMSMMDRVPQSLRRLISRIADSLPYSAYGKNFLRAISRPTALERYFEGIAPHFLLGRLYGSQILPPADTRFLARSLARYLVPGAADFLTQALYFEATAKLTGDILVKVDRMSMANSLEVRCPLLDHKLAEFAAQLPHAWKLRNGRGKQILTETLGRRLPPEVLNQPKRGFGVPLAAWFRGSLKNFLWDHLTDGSLIRRGMVSATCIRQLLEEHDRGRRNNAHYLWSLLMLELWLREYSRTSVHPAAKELPTAVV